MSKQRLFEWLFPSIANEVQQQKEQYAQKCQEVITLRQHADTLEAQAAEHLFAFEHLTTLLQGSNTFYTALILPVPGSAPLLLRINKWHLELFEIGKTGNRYGHLWATPKQQTRDTINNEAEDVLFIDDFHMGPNHSSGHGTYLLNVLTTMAIQSGGFESIRGKLADVDDVARLMWFYYNRDFAIYSDVKTKEVHIKKSILKRHSFPY